MIKESLPIAFLAFIVGTVRSAGWSYSGNTGPQYWQNSDAACGHNSQSPIDIIKSAIVVDKTLGPITFSGYDNPNAVFTLRNNGHSVVVAVSNANMTISGAKLPGTYELSQFHMHWGSTNNDGSEHLVNGKSYPMELHMVHFNNMYANTSDAMDKAQGLAVIGIFIKIGGQSTELQNVVSQLTNVPYKDNTTVISTFALNRLIPSDLDDYYRYSGSLTTPGCYESVVWTVMEEEITISQTQMDAFRSGLYEGSPSSSQIVNNFRPPQALNGRTVYASIGSRITHKTTTLILIPILTFLIMFI